MMKKITFLTACLASLAAGAQNQYVHQVIILNEGHYDYVNHMQTVPVTVGTYDPVSRVYAAFDTIAGARFATHVIVDGGSIYVAADSMLIRYDAGTHQRLFTTYLTGVRKLAIWNNHLLVTRGEYLQTFGSYFEAFDRNNLGFVYALPASAGPAYASEGIAVKNNVAYVAINNGFDFGNEVGLVGRVDLPGQAYLSEVNLGPGGKNPENISVEGNAVYTINNTDFTTASISRVDTASLLVTTNNLMTATGCGASVFSAGLALFQVAGDNRIGRFSTSAFSMHDTLLINKTIYGIGVDEVNHLLYAGQTDYLSYGKMFIYDFTGTVIDSFTVSVAPGNIAFDLRSSAGVHDPAAGLAFSVYPNPAHDRLRVLISGRQAADETLLIRDLAGREIRRISAHSPGLDIDISRLDAGTYSIESVATTGAQTRFVKQ